MADPPDLIAFSCVPADKLTIPPLETPAPQDLGSSIKKIKYLNKSKRTIRSLRRPAAGRGGGNCTGGGVVVFWAGSTSGGIKA
jgi:hypothetical protein